MLSSLLIKDVVLIEKLDIVFEKGLNVLSGETGAGKSILLDALGLALGERSDSTLIRAGADGASVTAHFEGPLPAALQTLLDEQALSCEETLILRRTISKDGKSRAFLNDQPIGVGLLNQIGETLLEVHGQFETHGLLNPGTHRGLLDAFAGLETLKKKTAAAYGVWQTALNNHAKAEENRARAEAEASFLHAAVAELDELAPQAGELDKLDERRQQLQNKEKIVEALKTAENALAGEGKAAACLAQAGKALARMADKAPGLAAILEIVDRASSDSEDASAAIARFAQNMDNDPETLEAIEQRFFKLRAIARKHGVEAETLGQLHEDLRSRLALLFEQGDNLAALAKAVMDSRAAYLTLAKELSARRAKAAEKMASQVMKELPPLKLERAVFMVHLEALPENQWGTDGIDRIAFLAATNPGTLPAPLGKVASGGELARFMLALKVVLAKADPVPTLVFDEVDSGIGGATASSVGERLAQLGRDVQVLVVTHSPQVAARATHHLRVEKEVKGSQARTSVQALDKPNRIEELARMLAGAEITDAARKAAVSLLEDSKEPERKAKK